MVATAVRCMLFLTYVHLVIATRKNNYYQGTLSEGGSFQIRTERIFPSFFFLRWRYNSCIEKQQRAQDHVRVQIGTIMFYQVRFCFAVTYFYYVVPSPASPPPPTVQRVLLAARAWCFKRCHGSVDGNHTDTV